MGRSRTSCDVAVVGGGPAGLAAALTLAAAGLAVTVVERSHYRRPRVGETLPPAVRRALVSLNALEALTGGGHLSGHGVRSLWGDDTPVERSFLFDPYGCGWHVDRRAFDAALARLAEQRGVELLRGSRIDSYRWCGRDPGSGGWRLSVATPDGERRLGAQYLVDASGRAASLGRRLGAVRRADDRLVGLVGLFGPTAASGTAAGESQSVLLIEACPVGWWYSAPLPGGGLVAALMTDADLAPVTAEDWRSRLVAASRTAGRCTSLPLLAPVRRVAADSSRLEPLQGRGWLAAGDAAVACDPLSGDGVQRALEGGRAAGEAALAALAGDTIAPLLYGLHIARLHHAYRQRRLAFYQREDRWVGSPFWCRRHAEAEAERSSPSLPPG